MFKELLIFISLFSILFIFVSKLCSSDQDLNGTFEYGESKPDGWSLSGGIGAWENEGYEGVRSISVIGTGANGNSNYWKSDNYRLLPKQTYRVIFMTKVSPGSSGGCIISGSNIANRDYSAGTRWEKRTFIFTTPNDTSNAFLRFGQWEKNGKVWFDNIEVNSVVPTYKKKDKIVLGIGERIDKGIYMFRPDFGGEYTNSSRPLFSHTAGFNSNRWLIYNTAEVIYRHNVQGYLQKSALVNVQIGYYTGGKCIVDVSNDGKNWQTVGELIGLGGKEFNIPESLFPSEEIFVKIHGSSHNGEPANLQVYGYSYNAKLDGNYIPDMIGETYYSDVNKVNENLDVHILSLGDLKPSGNNSILLKLENKDKKPIKFSISAYLRGTESAEFSTPVFSIRPESSQDVSVKYEIHKSGDYELLIFVNTTEKETLYSTRTLFYVPFLYSADYGYLISDNNECSIWWAEGTYKISKERPAPTSKNEKIQINSARNEYEPFQVVITPKTDIENIVIQTEPLINSSGYSIDNVDISLVGYVYIKTPTDRLGSVGYYPDPLPSYKKPFSVSAGENQPIWVTVYVPYDAPTGDYSGKMIIQSESWRQEIEILLHVRDFTLPKETHVQSAFGFSPWLVKRYHNLESDEELRKVVHEYYQNFARHRISPYNPTDPINVKFDPSDPDNVKIDFSAFDKSAKLYLDEMRFNTLQIPIQGMGGGTFHSRHLGEIAGYKQGTPEYERMFKSYLTQIQNHLEENGWLNKAYIYWFDEPEPKDYDFVKEGMALLKKSAPKMTRFLTEQPEPELYGSVDLWCPITSEYNHERAEERRKFGERFWWYICTGPKEPFCTLFIDHYATELRVWLWQTWKYKVEGILIWQSNYWTSQLVYPEPNLQNPYEDPMSYVSGYGNPVGYVGYWGNGDGRFIYPPVEAMAGEKSFSGPVNSIRWEMLREGIEDYEYFYMLNEIVNRLKETKDDTNKSPLIDEAIKLLLVPDEVTSSMTSFTVDPKPIYEHREKLARMIEELNKIGLLKSK
ncbi:MAG: glycoside hydrolase domain-containing protein [bacterium]